MSEILLALERIANLINRCIVYELLYLKPALLAAPTVQAALTRLYAAVLLYLAQAKRYCSRRSTSMCTCHKLPLIYAGVDVLDG